MPWRNESGGRIDRPHKRLRLSSILAGMGKFAKTFAGKLVTEAMLVKGINDTEACLMEIAQFIRSLKPSAAYLSIPTRPPALQRVRAPDEETVNRAYRIFADRMEQVEYLIGYEGAAFAFTGDIQKDLLSITAVHPMRREAVETLLAKAGASWAVVDKLLAQGELTEARHAGHLFYQRKFLQTEPSARQNEFEIFGTTDRENP